MDSGKEKVQQGMGLCGPAGLGPFTQASAKRYRCYVIKTLQQIEDSCPHLCSLVNLESPEISLHWLLNNPLGTTKVKLHVFSHLAN